MKFKGWKVKVSFVGDYEKLFNKDEYKERDDSEYRFVLAIMRLIEETGVVPSIDDWIQPLAKPDYSLDDSRISGRSFYTETRTIEFEIGDYFDDDKKTDDAKTVLRNLLPDFEKKLEEEATLISEAIGDVITISRMNDEDTATELIRKQFVVIDRQDLENDGETKIQ